MTIKTLVAGHVSPRKWAGTCPRCRGHFSWNDTDAIQINDKPGKAISSLILCPTQDCLGSVIGSTKN